MSEPLSPSRVEPMMDPGPSAGTAVARAPAEAPRSVAPASPPPPERLSTPAEQLARLEDKVSRIEEKLARSESATARVIDRFEASSHRMSEVAQQSELMAVRSDTKFIARRVRNLPGFSALILSSVITAVLTAALVVAIYRYLPGLMGR